MEQAPHFNAPERWCGGLALPKVPTLATRDAGDQDLFSQQDRRNGCACSATSNRVFGIGFKGWGFSSTLKRRCRRRIRLCARGRRWRRVAFGRQRSCGDTTRSRLALMVRISHGAVCSGPTDDTGGNKGR